MGKRELVALLILSSWCLVMVGRLFLAVPWSCLRFVIVVFPDHTHLLFLCWTLVLMRNTYCSFKLWNHFAVEEAAGCFTLRDTSFCCYRSLPLPHGAVGWSTMCHCGIYRSYSVNFWPYPVTLADVCAKVVVLFLLNHCLLLPQLPVGVICLVLVLSCNS